VGFAPGAADAPGARRRDRSGGRRADAALAGTGTRLLLAWDIGALVYLFLAWMVVARSDDDMTRVRAQQYDQSGYVIFLLVTTAASASFVAIGFLAGNLKALEFWPRAGYLTLTVAALLLSWLLIQTLFAFHYARLYYARPAGRRASTRAQVSRRGRTRLSRLRLLRLRHRMTCQVSTSP
jgi:uncharacterized membrane protein